VVLRVSVKAKATFKAISVREIRCGQRAARAEGFSRGHGFVKSDLTLSSKAGVDSSQTLRCNSGS